MNKIGIIVFLIIVLAGGLAFLKMQKPTVKDVVVACTMEAKICPDGSSVGRVGPSCEFAACPEVVTKAETLNADVYPLQSGITWGEEASTTLTLRDQKFIGTEVKSLTISNVTDISKVSVPFQKYYAEKLLKAGWVQNKNYSADSAGSSTWVYTKGSEYIVFSYKSEPVNKATVTPLTCPCNMVFTIFTGTVVK